jgi:hypothetical protein
MEVESYIPQEESVEEKLIDYEFAINERQNRMFETSTMSGGLSPSKTGCKEIESKLSEIEKEFAVLQEENERKMREKEELFMAELKKMEIEKEVEKAKLKEELRVKEQEARSITAEKERIEKIRDKLLEIEKERKEKQRKVKESMLIGEEDEPGELGSPCVVPNNKKKGSAVGFADATPEESKPSPKT